MSDSLWPYGLYPASLPCPWDSPSKNTGVGCWTLLQGMFLNLLNLPLLHLLHLQAGSLSLALPGRPNTTYISSVAQSCPTLCNPMASSKPGFPVHRQLPEFAQTLVQWVGDAIQPSYLLSSPSPAFNLSQYQGLFHWVGSSHQVAKVLKLQLQHQPFQWIFNVRLYL